MIVNWKPINTAPKDGTTIIIYWFATCRYYIAQWDLDDTLKEYAWSHEHGFIPKHITKLVWTEMFQHPQYQDYKHYFEK